MKYNTHLYYESGLKLGLPVVKNDATDGFNVRLGGKNYYFFNSTTPLNNGVSTIISSHKFTANQLLYVLNIPVPKADILYIEEFSYDKLIEVTKSFKFPVVVKPQAWSMVGKDVICNIPNLAILYEFCVLLFKTNTTLSLEEFHPNLNGYRVLVFENKVIDVLARYPAMVIGDGKHSIEKLVERTNLKRVKENSFYGLIRFDFEAEQALKEQKLTPKDVPKKGQKVIMGYACNASRGGFVRSYKGRICSYNKKLFIKIAKELNLDIAGIDVHCQSLHVPLREGNGIILEVNCSPSVRIHEGGIPGHEIAMSMKVMRTFIYKHPFSYVFNLFKLPGFRSIFIKIFISLVTLTALGLFGIAYYLGKI